MKRLLPLSISLLLAAPLCAQRPCAADEYLSGGPLAGLALPPFPTQHGEKPGYPGAVAPNSPDAEGTAPQVQLYPDSVENYRAYWFKYLPVRSFFDVQSQLKNWVAPNIPGAPSSQVESYAAPLYYVPRYDAPKPTGQRDAPAPVVRAGVKAPVFQLDCGTLEQGLYVVRVIGAVETDKLREFRLPLFWKLRVNDGPNGELSEYRIRSGYVDEFYSLAEIYFRAPQKRHIQAELWVDDGSAVDVLVHNISLDDALAGSIRAPIKTRQVLAPPRAATGVSKYSPEDRLRRDAAIWNAMPPVNAQGGGLPFRQASYHIIYPENTQFGAAGKTREQIESEFGKWEMAEPVDWSRRSKEAVNADQENALLINKKLGLKYTMDDLRHDRPLPAPYPYPDTGQGLYYPDPKDPKQGQVWAPIADDGVRARVERAGAHIHAGAAAWEKSGDVDAARDAAMELAAYAYLFPAIDPANYLSSLISGRGPYGREYRARRRQTEAMFMTHYANYVQPIEDYDALFDYIKDNQELANSIGRFVPWVKTPQDVRRLIDVNLVQTTAKRIMRYHYYTNPVAISTIAALVGDNKVTTPWMEWLFSRTFIYPLPATGIQDTMITGADRDGAQYIGSTFYAQGEGAMRIADSIALYLKTGGDKRFDLTDPEQYPKAVAQTYWRFRNVVAGGDFLRIGDVTGPDKKPGATLTDMETPARNGWEWTHDPIFAFVLKNYVGRGQYSDAEWAAIEKAAAAVPRAPWLDWPSRILPSWAGVLEAGRQHDDYRFRRAAYVRTGFGWGHHHDDTLDLQVVAHGLPMTIDGGQRPGYSKPADRMTRVHNVVEVDGQEQLAYSWTRALSDHAGARYLMAEASPPAGSTLFRRQVALVDVDEGRGSQPLPPKQQLPSAKLPADVVSGNSYVFDVFRVAGGKVQTYGFHGPLNDEFTWNAGKAELPTETSAAVQEYLKPFKEQTEKQAVGVAPSVLEATWRLAREKPNSPDGTEPFMLGANYDPASPRKYTRLHLFDVKGALAMQAPAVSTKWNYDFTHLMVQKRSDAPQQNAFVALIEPYVGEPFIQSSRLLPIVNNEKDALRAVALEVKTKNGHIDINFADGRPDKVRVLGSGFRVSSEYAFYSTDAQGLRQATLTGGTLLTTPAVRLAAAQRERTGKVTKVDYLSKTMQIDAPWPARSEQNVFEVGVPGHTTAYTATKVQPSAGGTLLNLLRGADYYRSRVLAVNPQKGTVQCVLDPIMQQARGNRAGWVASNDERTRFWRAEYLGHQTFKLTGAPISEEAFGKAGVLRLWEYGVGDSVRQSTSASLRRIAPNVFALATDVPVTLSLKAKSVQISSDGKTWKPAQAKASKGWLTLQVANAPTEAHPLMLRLTR
jgi:hypothetical protein